MLTVEKQWINVQQKTFTKWLVFLSCFLPLHLARELSKDSLELELGLGLELTA
jgi:hypothetical protein